MANNVELVQPPALPDPRTSGVFNNVLRLFFNRLTSLTNTLFRSDSGGGGKFLYFPYAYVYCDSDQTLSLANTDTVVELDGISAGSSDITISTNRITFTTPGVYKVDVNWALYMNAAAPGVSAAYLQLHKNGSRLTDHTRRIVVEEEYSRPVTTSAIVTIAAGDYLEVVWQADNTSFILDYHTSVGGTYPMTACVTYVSNG